MSFSIFGATMTEIVDISLEEESTPKRRLRSFGHVYEVNAANPIVPLVPYNVNRYKTFIVASDVSVMLTMDLPTVAPEPANTGALTPNTGIVCGTTGNGFDGYEFYGPDPIWAVNILANGNCRVNVVQTVWEAEDS